MNLNKAMLIGRLTRDPEMRYTPSGTPVTSFGIATNRYGTGPDGERKEFTDFHNIVAWNQGKRNLAEICAQYLRKGAMVYVEGRLQTRSWEGQDGQKRTRTEINANDVQFLDTRSGAAAPEPVAEVAEEEFAATPAGGGGAAATAAAPAAEGQDIDPDDIPF
jgi:single-strand DNA-binding protein